MTKPTRDMTENTQEITPEQALTLCSIQDIKSTLMEMSLKLILIKTTLQAASDVFLLTYRDIQAYAVTMNRRQLKCLLLFSKMRKRFQV